MTSHAEEPTWERSVSSLLKRDAVPAAQAAGQLLRRAEARWSGRVVPRTSMHGLLFTIPDDGYPFDETVRVSWSDGVFEFTLRTSKGSQLVTADRCHEGNALAVLDAFLLQLVGEPDVEPEGG